MDEEEFVQRLHGILPAVPTALTTDESLDEPAQRRIIEFLLDGGVHGLWVLGGGGEANLLTEAVRRRVVQVIVEATAGRVPVVVGVGEVGTKRTIDRIRAMEGLGIDAISVTAPFYYIHTQDDLLLHFETLLDATSLPMVIYHVPHNTSNPLTLDTVKRLAQNKQFAGIKDSGGSFGFTLELLRHCQRPDFRILQGWEDLLAPSLLLGADGAVMMVPVVAPRLSCNLYEAARSGDRDRAMALQADFNDLLLALGDTDASAIGAVKMALSYHGLCEPTLVKPLSPISDAHAERLRHALQEKGLLPLQAF
jgi:4-hydroxy-tetrahydrodipicolinate synthase